MPSARVFYPRWTRAELLGRLREGIRALAQEVPLEAAYLFGSWARGRALPGSDVDLLLVYQGSRREDLHQRLRRLLPGLPLEVHAYTQEEAQALAPLLARMREGGVALWGPEA